ncbi:MAG: TIGR00341 family protein [Patescibacteria group bacterium]
MNIVSKLFAEEKVKFLHGFYINTSLRRNFTEKKEAVSRLIDDSNTNFDYFVLLIISTLITTFGLLSNNGSIVIGGMLITPLLTSILALGLGFVTVSFKSLVRSSWAIIRSVTIVLFLSYLVSSYSGIETLQSSEILQRTEPSWFYVHIALLSGLAATYCWAKPKLSATLPGVAVAVALLPPLCVVGIGLSQGDVAVMKGAFDMFLVNFVGIVVSSVLVFSLLGFQRMKNVENKEIEIVENSVMS